LARDLLTIVSWPIHNADINFFFFLKKKKKHIEQAKRKLMKLSFLSLIFLV
jgi:hypothetical protein